MLKAKRVIIATIGGIIFGIVCMLFASSGPEPISNVMKLTIILSRTMIGFTIGISALRMKWWLHGMVIGLISSIPAAVPVLENSPTSIAVMTVVMGIIYGFLIELITTVIFKSPPLKTMERK